MKNLYGHNLLASRALRYDAIKFRSVIRLGVFLGVIYAARY